MKRGHVRIFSLIRSFLLASVGGIFQLQHAVFNWGRINSLTRKATQKFVFPKSYFLLFLLFLHSTRLNRTWSYANSLSFDLTILNGLSTSYLCQDFNFCLSFYFLLQSSGSRLRSMGTPLYCCYWRDFSTSFCAEIWKSIFFCFLLKLVMVSVIFVI